MPETKKKCDARIQILNEKTKICVKKTGRVALSILRSKCKATDKILHTTTSRCIKPDGVTARRIIRQRCAEKEKFPNYETKRCLKERPSSSASTSTSTPSFLRNDGRNSCYLDSTLVALLHDKRSPIRRVLLSSSKTPNTNSEQTKELSQRIRKELVNVVHIIDGKAKTNKRAACTNMRRMFKKYEKAYKSANKVNYIEEEWLFSQNSPSDVIQIMMRIFNFPHHVTTNKGKYFFNSPEIYALDDAKKYKVKDYIPKTTIHADNTDITSTLEYIQASCMYVSIMRTLNEDKVTAPVITSETIQLNKHEMHLSSIIVHQGDSADHGHYIAFIKSTKDNSWYMYDDLSYKLQKIGSFKDITAWHNGYIMKNSVGYFYTK